MRQKLLGDPKVYSFNWNTLLPQGWCSTTSARLLPSSRDVLTKGFVSSSLILSTLIGRLFRRLTFGLEPSTESTGMNLLRRGFSHVFDLLLVQLRSREFYKYLRHYFTNIFVWLLSKLIFFQRRTFWSCSNLYTTMNWIYDDSSRSWKIRSSLLLRNFLPSYIYNLHFYSQTASSYPFFSRSRFLRLFLSYYSYKFLVTLQSNAVLTLPLAPRAGRAGPSVLVNKRVRQ